MAVVIITQPTYEPVTLQEAKDQCRIDGVEQDAILQLYISVARECVEKMTGRALLEQTLEVTLDQWPSSGNAIVLPRATPLLSVTHVKYQDSAGAITTWATSEYIANTDRIPGRVVLAYGSSWPSFTPYPVSPIRVRYVAGQKNTSPTIPLPTPLKLAMLLLIGGFDENRESEVVTDRARIEASMMTFGVQGMIDDYIVREVPHGISDYDVG